MRVRLMFAAVLSAAALLLAACGGGSGETFSKQSTGSSSGSGGSKGHVVVGGANFTEMLIMQAMYSQLLQHAGYETETVTAGQREVYFPELASGRIGVVPEYAATLAEYLNVGANGAQAPPIATNDATTTVEAMRPLAEKKGVVILDPAKAADQNGFAVSKQFADQHSLKTLSDLGALGQPVVLAATEECPQRPFCAQGLTKTYGIKISEVKPTGFGSPQTKQA
ncbi:MAG: glycine betaine ABC transporter substrate-binding protein, partial [Actinomycetes bacterium]